MANASVVVNGTTISKCTLSYSVSSLGNKMGKFGNKYNITVNGVITHSATDANCATEILNRQKAIAEAFGNGVDVDVTLQGNGGTGIIKFKHCKLINLNFEDTSLVNISRYTGELESQVMETPGGRVNDSSKAIINGYGAFNNTNDSSMLEDFNESWDIVPEDSFGWIQSDDAVEAGAYRVTRTVVAVGKIGNRSSRFQGWEHARQFIKLYLDAKNGGGHVSEILKDSKTGNWTSSKLANHYRSFNVDKSSGTVTCTDTWLLVNSGAELGAVENTEVSVSAGVSNPFVKCTVSGTIKGLHTGLPDTLQTVTNASNAAGTAINQANKHWNHISANGNFGTCTLFRRANAAANVQMNIVPLSVTVTGNDRSGEVTYSVEYDNRPQNWFSNCIYEDIVIEDTYPGDQYAIIPVIGRGTGPILQYTFGRTEFRRSLTVEIQLDYTDLPRTYNRSSILLGRPSTNTPMKTELQNLIATVSPGSDAGIRKYFIDPPKESWNPKTGRYSLNVSWVYELNT